MPPAPIQPTRQPSQPPGLQPPRAERRPHRVESPNGVRVDDYYWLRDDTRESPEVLAYLNAENSYTRAVLGPHAALEESIYQEIIARIPPEDSSVPVLDRGYWYQTRFHTGQQYPIHTRWPAPAKPTSAANIEVLLDCNQLATGHDYFQVASYAVSDDNTLLAYAEDVVGRRQYRIRFKNLATGELLPDIIENAEPGFAWMGDNITLIYVMKDPVTLRASRVHAHVLGAPADTNVRIYEEEAEEFSVDVARSKSRDYVYISSESTLSSEWRLLDARAGREAASLEPRVFLARAPDHEYQIEHVGRRWFMRTNRGARNFRIVEVDPASVSDVTAWRDLAPHDEQVFLHDFEVFEAFVAVSERAGGLRQLRIQPLDGAAAFRIESAEAAYTLLLSANPQLQTNLLRYTYTSLTTPATTYDYDVRTRGQTLLKQEPVPGDFDSGRYRTEFLWAPAGAGERIPISLVYRSNMKRAAGNPLYLYGYGSYGHCIEPGFSSARLSLLDRGFVFAIAHIRGGQELGRRWYDDGRLLRKMNTFMDFTAARDFLVDRGYAPGDQVMAAGGSAGGLLMGAVANLAGGKYRALVAHVPFVDVVTTMLDESIPLTTLEYDEWGNPNEKAFYDYMLAYSPYDNVRAQDYPALLVTTGLWDSQVQYYEPAKWVAKLRACKTDRRALLLHTDMDAGHGGQSGRFRRQRDTAREYAFLLAELAGALDGLAENP